jgi:predicted membrane chloride channel (bestrophin family)
MPFYRLDRVSDEIEEPFSHDYNDLLLTTLSRMSEVNPLQILGETALKELLARDAQGVLL